MKNKQPRAFPRPGFELEVKDEQLLIDAWFPEKLHIEVSFSLRNTGGPRR
jgi:hypothetical protein